MCYGTWARPGVLRNLFPPIFSAVSTELAAGDRDIAFLVGPLHLIFVHDLVCDCLGPASAFRIEMQNPALSIDIAVYHFAPRDTVMENLPLR